MTVKVTVYDKDNCGECRKTEDLLDELGITYETRNMSHDKDALKKVKADGHRKAPAVYVGEESWSGHQPERILALVGAPEQTDESAEDDTWDF